MNHFVRALVATALFSVSGCFCLDIPDDPDGGVGGGSGGGGVGGGGTGGGGTGGGVGAGGGTAGGSGGGVAGGSGGGGGAGGAGAGCAFNVGMPQLTGPLTGIAASYAKGAQMNVGVPVDADTRRVTITIYDYNSPLQLGSAAMEVSPSTSTTIGIVAGITPPSGTYYISVDLCSTMLCGSPLQRNLHEKKALSSTAYTETRTISGMGIVETCSTGIPIQTFQIQ